MDLLLLFFFFYLSVPLAGEPKISTPVYIYIKANLERVGLGVQQPGQEVEGGVLPKNRGTNYTGNSKTFSI